MSRLLSPLILLMTAGVSFAQVEPPVRDRPVDFSGIVGTFSISSSAAPTRVEVEQPILLTVRIRGNGQVGYLPEQRKLRIFPPETDADFFVEAAPDLAKVTPVDGENLWEFVYRLRPKSIDAKLIPGLKLVMYHPGRRKFQPAFADAIPINVAPPKAPEIKLNLKVVEAPESFFVWRGGDSNWVAVRRVLFAAVVLGVPLACVVGALLWRRRHPSVEHVLARRRSRSAAKALAVLSAGQQAPERVAAVLVAYLNERLDFRALEATGVEVAGFLARRGAAKETQRRWSNVLDACAACRFGRAAPNGLDAEAVALVHALEEERCLSVR